MISYIPENVFGFESYAMKMIDCRIFTPPRRFTVVSLFILNGSIPLDTVILRASVTFGEGYFTGLKMVFCS